MLSLEKRETITVTDKKTEGYRDKEDPFALLSLCHGADHKTLYSTFATDLLVRAELCSVKVKKTVLHGKIDYFTEQNRLIYFSGAMLSFRDGSAFGSRAGGDCHSCCSLAFAQMVAGSPARMTSRLACPAMTCCFGGQKGL